MPAVHICIGANRPRTLNCQPDYMTISAQIGGNDESRQRFVSYLVAVLATYVLGAIFVSQGNIASVVQMGFEMTMSHRLDAMIHDVTHMYDIYLPVIAIAMLIALPVAAGIIRFVPDLRLIGYLSAGFVAMIAIHLTLKALLGLTRSTHSRIGWFDRARCCGFSGWFAVT